MALLLKRWLCRREGGEQAGVFKINFVMLYMILSQYFTYSGYCCSPEVQDYNCRVFKDHIVGPPCVAEVLEGHQKLKKEQQMVSLPLTPGQRSKGSHTGLLDWTKTAYLQHTALVH